MLGLLLDTDPDLLSEEPFLWVQNGEPYTQTCEPRISEKHPYLDWKGQFSRTCSEVIGVTPSRQKDPSLSVPLIWHNFMKMFEFSFHSLESLVCLDSLSASTFIDPGKYSAVIAIFHFKRYYQISLLIVANSWFLVTPFLLSMTELSCCPCGCELILHPFPLM